MNRQTWFAALALLLVAVAAYLLWPHPSEPAPDTAPAPAPSAPEAAPSAPADMGASAPASAAATPAPAPPIGEPARNPAAALPPLAAADPLVKETLSDTLGRKTVLEMLQTDGFVQRVVATADNLTRPQAPTRLWPVNPTEGRFSVDARNQIAAENAGRYLPFVLMLERVEPAQAATLYRRFYPLMQQSYEDLGYPGKRFHTRLIEVIDHLLATPQPAQPPTLTLTEVKGPYESQRPWVRYEYTDPQLEALSSGQKILLRMGDSNERRVMSWLRAFRAQIAR